MKLRLRYTREGWFRFYPLRVIVKGEISGLWIGPFATAEDAKWLAGLEAAV